MTLKDTVAFLGIGLMGLPMAKNLLAAGFRLNVWNRTPDKAAALAPFGATPFSSPAEAVRDAAIIITMLADGPAVGDVLFAQGAAAAMRQGAILVDMSSIKPAEARDHAARLGALGVAALDAPVSGGTKGAAAASLAIMAGGDADAFARAAPVLGALGRPVRVGPAGAGQVAKLANQGIVAITIGAVAEALLLAETAGLDKGALRAALAGGFADSVILQQHGARMEERAFAPGGRSASQLKDLDNLLDAASGFGVSLPLAAMQRARFATLAGELGAGDLDHSALWLELQVRQAD